jgi:hypothetical protein
MRLSHIDFHELLVILVTTVREKQTNSLSGRRPQRQLASSNAAKVGDLRALCPAGSSSPYVLDLRIRASTET